jgi:hypothetical protein
MKIKMLQAYQAVRFENKLNTFFVDERYANEGHGIAKTLQCRLEVTEHGVLVYGHKSAVLVGWANIGSLELDRESVTPKQEEMKKAETKKPTTVPKAQ